MPFITYRTSKKANSLSLFFTWGTFILFSLLSAFFTFSHAFAVPQAPTTLVHSLPEVLTIPIVQARSVVVEETLEAHLNIPKIGVDAVIKDMGVTREGAMEVPGNRIDVGWFSFGTRPGETGSAVIGGHNVWDSGAGVFSRLDQLEKGDVLSVVDSKGVSTSFTVRDMRTYDATDANTGIFESKSGIHLNLITCSGDFDPLTKTYTKRLVIFTDLLN